MSFRQRDNEVEASEDTPGEESEKPGIGRRLREAMETTGERVTGTADTITGAQFRRQFEDFTDAVTTAVVGVHRDNSETQRNLAELDSKVERGQTETRRRLDEIEPAVHSRKMSPLVMVFGLFSLCALLLSIAALVRTF